MSHTARFLCGFAAAAVLAGCDRGPAVEFGGQPGEVATVRVGTDVEPGTYRAADPAGDDCYWVLRVRGVPVDSDQDIGGHRARRVVVLMAGQYFVTGGCGAWSLDA